MSDSTATYEHCIEAARVALGAGNRAAADLALRSAISAAERINQGQLALAAALIKLGELRQEEADAAEAEELFRRALQVSEDALGPDDLGLVPALMSLGSIQVARGAPSEAEPLLTRALTISEQSLGRDHPDLAGLLNDLSRLYLKQGAHAYAEPLLQRLHAIKRSKGDDHPEVATVLASLAAVRQALGRHEAAEQLWRRVLEIRERTLAPNHFAIATALEHLAETCAARGNLEEALRLYQRSIGMREVTLGAGHASVRAARERVADLRLQGSETGLLLDGGDRRGALAEWRPAAALTAPVHAAPSSPPRDAGRPIAAFARPAFDTRPAIDIGRFGADFARAPEPRPVVSRDSAPVAEAESPAAEEGRIGGLRLFNMGAAGQPPVSFVMPYGDATAYADEPLEMDDDVSGARRRGAFVGSMATMVRKRPWVTAGAAVAMLTLLLVAAMQGNSLSGSEADQPPTSAASVPSQAFPIVPQTADSAATRASASNGDSDAAIGADDASTPVPVASRSRPTPERTSPSRSESRPPATPPTQSVPNPAPAVPDIPLPRIGEIPGATRTAVSAQLDSVMRSLSTSPGSVRESFTPGRSLPSMEPGRVPSTAEVEASTAFQSPRLIGSLPRTRYPASLRSNRMEGEVIVEFSVDTTGLPDMATLTVVRSAHELFTAAVREVIPTMRFIPAQARGQKTRAGVQIPFKFSVDRQD